ncbi:hypothetical protein QTJ16_006766 [Diplocarpon rosae]|uniref:2EXR domain-containing protein n=1 Tax=Diplocarpon rosae TaxID=946125 RepID=A0AAD9SVC9_9HELO|nr:hypothetical protein QTJ16_006766 [Diplocarpon rosae]
MNRTTLISFELFPNLPTEIRLQIWGLAAQEPRQLALMNSSQLLLPANSLFRKIKLRDSYRPRPGSILSNRVENQTRLPSIVHASQESREVGLRFYTKIKAKPTLYMSDSQAENEKPQGIQARTSEHQDTFFVNFDIDVFEKGISEFFQQRRNLPTQDDYNFPVDVLRKIQRIDQLPCYVFGIVSYEEIHFYTECNISVFCQPFWEALAHVTAYMNDHCYGYKQENFAFHCYLQTYTKRAQAALGRLSEKHSVPKKFAFSWKCKDLEDGESLDPVPCEPYDRERMQFCFSGGVSHDRCLDHFRGLNALNGP